MRRAKKPCLSWSSWGGAVDGAEVVLLLADDAARAHDAEPAHGLAGAESVRTHQVACDEGAGAAEAGLAVHGDKARRGVDDAEEGGDNMVRGASAVLELEIVVCDPVVDKVVGIVLGLVKADDVGNTELVEDVDIVQRAEVAIPFEIVAELFPLQILWWHQRSDRNESDER